MVEIHIAASFAENLGEEKTREWKLHQHVLINGFACVEEEEREIGI